MSRQHEEPDDPTGGISTLCRVVCRPVRGDVEDVAVSMVKRVTDAREETHRHSTIIGPRYCTN
ncbi:MAG: hypothetical protein KC561_19805, partial [Myxococcales bacterium]|nr:hypothetical protein [Myxococcales bacterium]